MVSVRCSSASVTSVHPNSSLTRGVHSNKALSTYICHHLNKGVKWKGNTTHTSATIPVSLTNPGPLSLSTPRPAVCMALGSGHKKSKAASDRKSIPEDEVTGDCYSGHPLVPPKPPAFWSEDALVHYFNTWLKCFSHLFFLVSRCCLQCDKSPLTSELRRPP